MKTISSIANLFLKDKVLIICLLLLSSLLVIDPFFHRGIFTAHDMDQNIAHFGAFYSSFMEGNLIPRWAKDLARGYGGPFLMFSYSVPYYLALPFHLFGLSLADSIKILNLLTLVASAGTMYFFLRCYFKPVPSFFGSLFYVFAPYRISNIYARGSLGENVAFVFVPLTAFLLARYWEKPTMRKISLLALSFALIILSHPFFGIITMPFFLGYTGYLFLKDKSWAKLRGLTIALILAFGLTAYLTIPLLIEIKYVHYDISPFANTYLTEGLTFSQLILPQWTFVDKTGKTEYQTWQLGLLNLGLFISSLVIFLKEKAKERNWLGLGIIIFILSCFLSLKVALPLYVFIEPIRHIQFPWRFLALNTLSLPLLAASVFSLAQERLKKSFFLLGGAVVVMLVVLSFPYARGHNYQEKSDEFYLSPVIVNTGGVGTFPRWAAEPEQYPQKIKQIEIITGSGIINELSLSSASHQYQIEAKNSLYLVDNTLYFPGWQVTVDKQETPIEFQNESFRGLITFEVPQGVHNVEVKFGETKLRQLADIISLSSLLLAFTLILFSKWKPRYLHPGL